MNSLYFVRKIFEFKDIEKFRQKCQNLNIAKIHSKNNFRTFFRYFIITTHVAQLLQLSELLCALLQFFASGAAQKSPKFDITRIALKNNSRTFFSIFFNQNACCTAVTTVRTFLCTTSNFRLWRSAKVAKIWHTLNWLEKLFQKNFSHILWSECILYSFYSYQNCSVHYFNFLLWRSAKVAKFRHSENWCKNWFQEIFSNILWSEHLLCSFHSYRNLSVHNFKFSLPMLLSNKQKCKWLKHFFLIWCLKRSVM